MFDFQHLDFVGVAIFAATGALAASRKQMDIIGFVFLATMTGVGGGTLRDLLIGQAPVFWMRDGWYLAVCAGVAAIVYFTAPMIESRYRLLLWLDALGVSAYCVLGAQLGLAAGVPPMGAVATGIMTATMGGILRDVVSGEPSVLLRREIYVTAAFAGAGVHVLGVSFGMSALLSAAAGCVIAFLVRGGALRYGWQLPGYRHRPGRPVEAADRREEALHGS